MRFLLLFLLLFIIIFLFRIIKFTAHKSKKDDSHLNGEGCHDIDDRNEFNKLHHHVLETEYSWTNYWQSELEFHVSDKKVKHL